MSLLFRIVYAAHAKGTHHKLALDALRSMRGEQSDAWTRVFLKHADVYMVGAKAPDDTFKDFKNHVLHVGEKYWGGAPEAVAAWYGKTVTALKEQRWADAVYAAGVTSHYYTDPIHPFHTGQTEAENAIHRAAEWSINRSYNDLRALGAERYPALEVPVPAGADWLKEMVCDGAEFSHRYYEKLIAHYDIHRGVTDPPAGLDGIARGIVAELLIYAATGFSRILEKAIAEAAVAPPHVELGLDTIMAAIKIPAKALAKRLSNAQDRAIVEAMYDELKATGKVDKTLPEDDRTVRDLHAVEVLGPKRVDQSAKRASRLQQVPVQQITQVPAAKPAVAVAKPPAVEAIKLPDVERTPTSSVPSIARPTPPAPPREPVIPPKPSVAVSAPVPLAADLPPEAQNQIAKPALLAEATSVPTITPRTVDTARRVYLAETDALEAAPSIGPKMAERFAALGIDTVAQFLDADPAKTATRLADRRIDADLIETWQYQALLVMEIPGLRGTHAQLLTGAGYQTAEAVAMADPVEFSADILRFAATTEGKRILRDGAPPDIEKIKAWVNWAANARAA